MSTIPVFAGLGSDLLFAEATYSQAASDAEKPNGRVLVEACHQAFIDEVALAHHHSDASGINLDDFRQPGDILKPTRRHHHNPIVQHATLCLVQLLRYQDRNLANFASEAQCNVAASGFCIGLFAATAVASARTPLEYLNRAVECFRVAVLFGIAVEREQKKIVRSNPLLPWSMIVKSIDEKELSQRIAEHSFAAPCLPIYISCRTSETCFTISGQGEALQNFIETALPETCVVRPTNLYGLYHSRAHLKRCRDELENDLLTRAVVFPCQKDLICPLISTVDGSLLQPQPTLSSTELLESILDMVFLDATDWAAVQNTVVSLAEKSHTDGNGTLDVCNYGPGYGALSHRKDLESTLRVQDVSHQTTEKVHCEDDIAIIGMGVDLPGAPDAETLWRNLMEGKSACSEIPSDRFHLEDYYNGNGARPRNHSRSMGTKFGNFLEDPFLFDTELFGISPREAPSIDPQQRLMLQAVYRSLENAGYVPDSSPTFSRETFGCFIGNATLDYVDNLRNCIDVYYSPGTLRAFLSGRISYAFKWSGPSITLDTACSSSLTALHHAARALIAGECRAAVVGGVNVMTSPDMFLGLDKAHFLSQTGQCKSFDESADGYCRSEGCVAFVLKRLKDATNENDRILGVVKATAINQSGNSSSITHPHSPTQERLFQTLLERSGVQPGDVTVVEAHGTGTQAGDPNELRSIRNTFALGRTMENPLHVGSIKANIGHCEAASGGASLAKLILMLKHKQIPPQTSLKRLNPAIDNLGSDGLLISIEAKAWGSAQDRKRTALLNNFGAAGSNAALLLQEYEAPTTKQMFPDGMTTFVFGCSAKSMERLERMRQELLTYLKANKNSLSIADVCYTSTARRSLCKYRISSTTTSIQGLIEQLAQTSIIKSSERPRDIVFLFSGQGSQYLGMGRDLMRFSSKFRSSVYRCHQLLMEWGFPSCMDVIEPNDAGAIDLRSEDILQSLQTGVFVLEVALALLLIEYGIRPSMVTGHSLGEYAALVVAGVLDFDSGLWLVAQRAHLIVKRCDLWKTSMLAVNLNADYVRNGLLQRAEFHHLCVCCENSINDCVIGGDVETLNKLKEILSIELKARSMMLNVPVAYHSSALEPILNDLRKAASHVALSPPETPIASNTHGRVIQPGENVFTPEYFANHCRNVVAFDRGVVDILEYGEAFESGMWLEVGPSPQLLPMVTDRLSSSSAVKLPALKKGCACHNTLADIFSAMYCDAGDNMNWRALFYDMPSQPQLIDLPPMPMVRERYFVPFEREVVQNNDRTIPSLPDTPFTVIERVTSNENDATASYETPIHRLANLIEGHIVCGQALCPGSVYGEMALAAAIHASDSCVESIYKLSDVSFTRPLIYTKDSSQIIRVILRDDNLGTGQHAFEISSTDGTSGDARIHCTGKIKQQCLSKISERVKNKEQSLMRRKVQFTDGKHQSFMASIMYRIFGRVVDYSEDYHAVQKIYMDENAEEIFAECKLPVPSIDNRFAGQPVLLDAMLHVAGFVMNLNVDKDSVCICQSVQSTTLHRKLEAEQRFEVHCSNFISTTDANIITADAYAVDAQGIVAIVKGMQFRRQKLAKIQAAFEFTGRKPAATVRPPAFSPLASPMMQGSSNTDHDFANSNDPTVIASDEEDNAPGISIIQVLSETTGLPSNKIQTNTELTAIGVDSMMIFEIERKLNDGLGKKLASAELSACETVQDMESLVHKTGRSSGSTTKSSSPSRSVSRRGAGRGTQFSFETDSPLSYDNGNNTVTDQHNISFETGPDVPPSMIELLRSRLRLGENPEVIQKHDTHSPPLYLVHPGAGMCHEYYRIGSLGRFLKAIHDPRIFSDFKNDWASITDMANAYATIIRESQHRHPSSTIILGGYSFGGTVAFETARLLSSCSDFRVGGVILIDSPPPFNHTPIALETIKAAMVKKHLQPEAHRSEARAQFEEAIGALAIRNNVRRAALLGRHLSDRNGPMPHVVLLRSSQGFEVLGSTFPANEWLHDRTDVRTSAKDWEDLTHANVRTIDIPGDHFTPFEAENIRETTSAILQACELLDRR